MKYSETVFINKLTLLYEMLENEYDIFHDSNTSTIKDISIFFGKKIISYISEEIEIFFTYLTKNEYYKNFDDICSIIKKMQNEIEVIERNKNCGSFLFSSDAVERIKEHIRIIDQLDFSHKDEDKKQKTKVKMDTTIDDKTLIQLIDNCSDEIYYANIDNKHLNILKWLQDEVLLFDKANIHINYNHKINIKEL